MSIVKSISDRWNQVSSAKGPAGNEYHSDARASTVNTNRAPTVPPLPSEVVANSPKKYKKPNKIAQASTSRTVRSFPTVASNKVNANVSRSPSKPRTKPVLCGGVEGFDEASALLSSVWTLSLRNAAYPINNESAVSRTKNTRRREEPTTKNRITAKTDLSIALTLTLGIYDTPIVNRKTHFWEKLSSRSVTSPQLGLRTIFAQFQDYATASSRKFQPLKRLPNLACEAGQLGRQGSGAENPQSACCVAS